MTTATSKVLTEVYEKDDFNFQVMYMPLDTGVFYNDGFVKVLSSMMPIAFVAILKLATQVVTYSSSSEDEGEIQSKLCRIGMRKSVELYL